jgi:hypothetical protein|eukprot:COSAG02_NODE_3668_length_6398_cov_3.344975_4_plen_81_part_00
MSVHDSSRASVTVRMGAKQLLLLSFGIWPLTDVWVQVIEPSAMTAKAQSRARNARSATKGQRCIQRAPLAALLAESAGQV